MLARKTGCITAVTVVSLLQMAQFYRTAAVHLVVLSVTSPQKPLQKPDRRSPYRKTAVPIFIEVYYYNRKNHTNLMLDAKNPFRCSCTETGLFVYFMPMMCVKTMLSMKRTGGLQINMQHPATSLHLQPSGSQRCLHQQPGRLQRHIPWICHMHCGRC